jgi:putative acetyltransferase
VSVVIRPAQPDGAEADAILAIVDDAFSDETRDASEELDIVRGTWSARPDRLELVADGGGGELVGHVLAAAGVLAGQPVVGVAPLGVVTRRQRAGIGRALMNQLIADATERAWPMLLLLGDPAYYGRFGFEPAATLGIFYAPAGRDSPHFMVRRLPAYRRARQLTGEFRYCWEL